MIKKRIVLKFPHRLVDQPIISRMIKGFDLEFNIQGTDFQRKEYFYKKQINHEKIYKVPFANVSKINS